jgi:hypothetical protein
MMVYSQICSLTLSVITAISENLPLYLDQSEQSLLRKNSRNKTCIAINMTSFQTFNILSHVFISCPRFKNPCLMSAAMLPSQLYHVIYVNQ